MLRIEGAISFTFTFYLVTPETPTDSLTTVASRRATVPGNYILGWMLESVALVPPDSGASALPRRPETSQEIRGVLARSECHCAVGLGDGKTMRPTRPCDDRARLNAAADEPVEHRGHRGLPQLGEDTFSVEVTRTRLPPP